MCYFSLISKPYNIYSIGFGLHDYVTIRLRNFSVQNYNRIGPKDTIHVKPRKTPPQSRIIKVVKNTKHKTTL